jgi:hypothetical protein
VSYAKVFDSMLTSSVWQESHATVRVWLTMLLLKDQDGIVNAAVPGLAHAAHVTLDECQQALAVLSGPDPFSRTPTLEGRRIVQVDSGGWRVVNHEKYRELPSKAERRAYKRHHEQERRERQRVSGNGRKRGPTVDTRGQT